MRQFESLPSAASFNKINSLGGGVRRQLANDWQILGTGGCPRAAHEDVAAMPPQLIRAYFPAGIGVTGGVALSRDRQLTARRARNRRIDGCKAPRVHMPLVRSEGQTASRFVPVSVAA